MRRTCLSVRQVWNLPNVLWKHVDGCHAMVSYRRYVHACMTEFYSIFISFSNVFSSFSPFVHFSRQSSIRRNICETNVRRPIKKWTTYWLDTRHECIKSLSVGNLCLLLHRFTFAATLIAFNSHGKNNFCDRCNIWPFEMSKIVVEINRINCEEFDMNISVFSDIAFYKVSIFLFQRRVFAWK